MNSSRLALIFICITVLIDTIGFGIIIPVMPELIMELTGEGLGRAAIYGGWLLFVYSLMQFFFAPIIGNLGDRFGRRPVLLFSLLAFGIDYALMGIAPTLAWLFVGRSIAGITGASFATANAYIAGFSPPEERAKNFGLLGAAWGLGLVMGPIIGGILGEYGTRVPFFAAAALALLNVTYGFFVLPESLAVENRRPFELRRANPVGALMQMRKYPIVIGLFVVLFLYQFAHDTIPTIWTYHMIEKFEWDTRQIGYSLGFLGLLMVFAQGFLIRWIIDAFGERLTTYGGLVLFGIGFLGFAFLADGWAIYLAMIPFAAGALASPAMRGIMSRQVSEDSQGELQGAIASIMSSTAIVTPLVMTHLFGYFTSETAPVYFPGAAFFLAAVLMFVSVFVFGGVMRRARIAMDESAPG